MENGNVEEKIQQLKSSLFHYDWEFKKYINLEECTAFLENEDIILETLNTVKEFYVTESLILSDSNVEGEDEFKDKLAQVSELHDLLLKFEFIYVYKLSKLLEMPKSSDKSFELFKFLDFEIKPGAVLLNWLEDYEFWDVYYYYYWRMTHLKNSYLDDESFDIWLIESLLDFTQELAKRLPRRISSLQETMLSPNEMLHFVNIRNTRMLHKKFPKWIKQSLIALGGNIYEKAFNDDGIYCYATIEFNGNKYITVNGLDLEKNNKRKILGEFTEVLQNLGKRNIEIVDISDDVRYYFDDHSNFIDYKSYKNWKDESKHTDEYNRMFTCCERKLFAKIREVENKELCDISSSDREKIHLSTTKYPCDMCEREIYVNGNNYRINVSSLDKKGKGMDLKDYDDIAKKINSSKV